MYFKNFFGVLLICVGLMEKPILGQGYAEPILGKPHFSIL